MSKKLSLFAIAGSLWFLCATAPGQGLQGEYFRGMTLSGTPVLTRVENVAFNWGGNAPDPAVGADSFSVRWTGSITPTQSGDYVFATQSDDGVRLWLAGDLIINNWGDHSATMNTSQPVPLKAGKAYGIKLEFYENGGDAVIELYWSLEGETQEIIPADALSPIYVVPVQARKPNPPDGTIGVIAPLLEWQAGDTALLHNVYLGTTPELTEADLVSSRQMFTLYYHVPGVTPGATYYWRVDEIEKDGVTTHTGDVWSFVMQAATAYYPDPPDGTADASPTPRLTWEPGTGAIQHHLYFGDDLDAVTQGTAAVDQGLIEPNDPNFRPGPLEVAQTYYWRVDEILFGGDLTPGPVWSFTTYLSVDDFESYNDEENQGTRIYETWIDGWTNGTGSQVGYTDPPFAEQRIVHRGLQSMPLDYNNVNTPFYSEAYREFAPLQDWTVGGVDTLVISIRGRGSNSAAPLYVTLEDASQRAVTLVHPDPAVTNASQWVDWQIPLSSLAGVNFGKVQRMYLGVGDRTNPTPDGTGTIYIDDIRVLKLE
jgi:hypothetical protein